jgi:hypothetical protein
VASVLAAALLASCGPHYPSGSTLHGEAACARADSFFAVALPRPARMSGRATFDVDSYRVRGHFRLELSKSGDAVLEFSGSTLLGGHREDAVISLSSDTLRVLDRERGRYYEGEQVADMVESGTHTEGAWLLGLQRVLASGCPGIETARADETGLSGAGADGPFSLQLEGGRLAEATWPNPAPSETFRDRLEVRYRWKDGQMVLLEALLPERGWRIRLEAD